MINENHFTKLRDAMPNMGCECLCLMEDEFGTAYYGVRSYDGFFEAFYVEDDEEKIIAWLALPNVYAAYDMLHSEQNPDECDASKAQ